MSEQILTDNAHKKQSPRAKPIIRRSILSQIIPLACLAPIFPLGVSMPAAVQPAVPNSDRTAEIRRWHFHFEAIIQISQKMQAFLEQANLLPSEQVDGLQLAALEKEFLDTVDDLISLTESTEFDDLYRAVTGHDSYFWCLKQDGEK